MKIHQMLHGYIQGHDLITSSKKLDVEDMDLMKRLSDWTGFLPHDEEGYLTMYPLPSNNNLYVIAKTWYASEMKRPGCVWTHSIIINLADLVVGFDFIDLLNLFVRPKDGNYENYSKVINYIPSKIKNNQANGILKYNDIIFCYGILCQLNSPTIARTDHKIYYYDLLCMSVLQFLPIGFLQKATVCTGIRSNRLYKNEPFLLQFSEEYGNKISDIYLSSQNLFINQFPGISYLCNAIVNNNTDTADSLRLFSQDILSSVQGLNAIGNFLKALDYAMLEKNSVSFFELYNYILKSFPNSEDGTFVKTVLCSKNVSNLFDKELNVLSFLATTSNVTTDNSIKIEYKRRVHALTKKDYIEYLSRLSKAEELNILGKEEIIEAGRLLSVNDLILLMNEYWSVFYLIIVFSPEILYHEFWFDIESSNFSKIFEIIQHNQLYGFSNWSKLYSRLLDEKIFISDNIYSVISINVVNAVHIYLDYINKTENSAINYYPDKDAASKPNEVVNWLKHQNYLSKTTVQFIINNISPQSTVIRQSKSSDWVVFAKSQIFLSGDYYIFLFKLSHNWKDNTALNFLKISFYSLHSLLAKDELTDSQKMCLKSYFADVPIWQEWDNCKKLRKGLVQDLYAQGYNPNILIDFTPDRILNINLLRIWRKISK